MLFITNKTEKRIPRSFFERAFRIVTKKHTMEVSVVLLNERAMRALNKQWRKKEYVPNVLAFPLEVRAGEIFISPHRAAKEAHERGISYREWITYLFLHGLLHLHGYDHEGEEDAKNMEKKEQKIMNTIFAHSS